MQKHFDKSIGFITMLIISLFLIVAFITGLGVSCQSQAPAAPAPSPEMPGAPAAVEPPAAPLQIEVAIEGFAFKPAEITVPVGSTVTWYNKDTVAHTATARNMLFDSGRLSQGDTFSYTFEEKGTFEYYCVLHPYMTGTVTVQ